MEREASVREYFHYRTSPGEFTMNGNTKVKEEGIQDPNIERIWNELKNRNCSG